MLSTIVSAHIFTHNKHIFKQIPNMCKGFIKYNQYKDCSKEFSTNITKNSDVTSFSSVKTQYFIDKRHKHSSEKKDNEWGDDSSLSKDSKVSSLNLGSMRIDLVIKSALKISRNKIEVLFYESKFRKNGKKVLKKSANCSVGDEIDVVKSVSSKNPSHLVVSRVEILDAVAQTDNIAVTVRIFKTLLIENYDDPWKEANSEST